MSTFSEASGYCAWCGKGDAGFRGVVDHDDGANRPANLAVITRKRGTCKGGDLKSLTLGGIEVTRHAERRHHGIPSADGSPVVCPPGPAAR